MADEHLDDDSPNRHAPEGYTIAMQFFAGETEAEALKEAGEVLGTDNLKIAPGHFHYDEDSDAEPEFRPFGWMVFQPIRKPAKSRRD
jgi:hypothetical protein